MSVEDIMERWARARLAGERVDGSGQRWVTVEVPCAGAGDPRDDVRWAFAERAKVLEDIARYEFHAEPTEFVTVERSDDIAKREPPVVPGPSIVMESAVKALSETISKVPPDELAAFNEANLAWREGRARTPKEQSEEEDVDADLRRARLEALRVPSVTTAKEMFSVTPERHAELVAMGKALAKHRAQRDEPEPEPPKPKRVFGDPRKKRGGK